jgi:hypothetical protein
MKNLKDEMTKDEILWEISNLLSYDDMDESEKIEAVKEFIKFLNQ